MSSSQDENYRHSQISINLRKGGSIEDPARQITMSQRLESPNRDLTIAKIKRAYNKRQPTEEVTAGLEMGTKKQRGRPKKSPVPQSQESSNDQLKSQYKSIPDKLVNIDGTKKDLPDADNEKQFNKIVKSLDKIYKNLSNIDPETQNFSQDTAQFMGKKFNKIKSATKFLRGYELQEITSQDHITSVMAVTKKFMEFIISHKLQDVSMLKNQKIESIYVLFENIHSIYSNYLNKHVLCDNEYAENKAKFQQLSLKHSPNILARALYVTDGKQAVKASVPPPQPKLNILPKQNRVIAPPVDLPQKIKKARDSSAPLLKHPHQEQDETSSKPHSKKKRQEKLESKRKGKKQLDSFSKELQEELELKKIEKEIIMHDKKNPLIEKRPEKVFISTIKIQFDSEEADDNTGRSRVERNLSMKFRSKKPVQELNKILDYIETLIMENN